MMPKKITSLLTAAVMLLSLFIISPGIALAFDETTWDGTAREFTQGSGTEADPYIIDTAGKLAYLAQRVNEGNSVYQSAYYSLTEDLDLNGLNWVQIGNGSFVSAVFQGCFDGNGHKITGMNVDITSGSFAGLFGGTNGAMIKNLSVSGNVKVINNSSGWAISGGIVGSAENGSKIINCCHSGDIEAKTNKSSSDASRSGGIAGSNHSSEIINCYHLGNVTADNPNGPPYNKKPNAGGVVGYIEAGGTAEYCYWNSEDTITPANTYGIGSARETVANVVYFSGTTPTLATEITVGGTTTDDLLTALNANLDELEDDTLNKWTGSDGYPTFDSIKWSGGTPAASSDATLSSLTISSGTLSPAFASDTTSYTASVANSIASVNVTATVNQADASVTINTSAAASNTPAAVDLDVGANTITIEVTAQDDSTETYTITITRAAASDAAITPLAADFDKYTEAAGYADVAVTKSDGDHTLGGIKNGTTVLTEDADYTITGNTVIIKKEYLAALTAGTVVLTFDYSGGTRPVLTITITNSTPAVSSDATLSALTISSGTLLPAFVPGTTDYTASVAHNVASVDITATVNQENASLTINGSAAANGTPTSAALNVGNNTFTIVVTAQDNSTTETYTLNITRAAASSSSGGGGGGKSPAYYSASVDANGDNGAVTFDKTRSTAGSKVTITVTPEEGYTIDRLIILDQTGREVDYTENEDGTYSFTMPSGDITVNALFTAIPALLPDDPPALPFADVQESDWYFHAVDYVFQNQWFTGTNEEQFEPNTPMSRAMLVTVLWRMEGQANIDVNQIFTDVPAGEYYAGAVNWANRQEIIQGYGNGVFGPLDNITREQMALILYNFAQFKGYDTSAATDLDSYHDGSTVSPWSLDAVKWAVASQILSGKGDGVLDPSGPATRAETASILMRLITSQED